MSALLSGRGLTRRFGGLIAVDGLDFDLSAGELVGLIGPNGAGKTTLFNLISGIASCDSGEITMDGRELTSLPAFEVCRRGIGRTFQIVRPFLKMTCLENVLVGIVGCGSAGGRDEARTLLKLVGLDGSEAILAERFTLIEKKRLELARALAGRPKVLLLDEVLSGLNPTEITAALELIALIRRDFGVAILWIEHVMGAIMKASDRVIAMDQGKVISVGRPAEVAADPKVITAYLGQPHA